MNKKKEKKLSIATDKNGDVFLYSGDIKRNIETGTWDISNSEGAWIFLDKEYLKCFKNLVWESEPILVKIVKETDLRSVSNVKEFLKILRSLNLLNPDMIKTRKDFDDLVKILCG